MAFVSPLPLASASARAALPSTSPCMSVSPAPISRRFLLTGAGLAAAAAFSATVAPLPPNTGLDSSFSKAIYPRKAFNTPGDVLPGTVTIDKRILNSAEGKDAPANLRKVSEAIKAAGADFEADVSNFDNDAALQSVKIDQLRNVLNVSAEAFDEETQKTTDKITRDNIQDICVLAYNGCSKKGAARTDKKVDKIRGWLKEIDGDSDCLLRFYNAGL